MFNIKNLFFIILSHLIIAKPQINLYFTDRIQHDCLHVVESNINRQIMSYCISESILQYNIQTNDQFPKFTFAELLIQNITSEQLYLWSTPIDIIEDYQLYLNELLISNHSSLGTKVFYNCTLPRFGSQCEYELVYYHLNYSSLSHIIHDFYSANQYKPSNMTCYTHLECDRGPLPSCLDWSEICDGKIDCRNNGIDEEHCWQLEINECTDNEYRCANGQCIPKSFYLDDSHTPDCLDQSDELRRHEDRSKKCEANEPTFGCEDVTCKDTPLTSSCVKERKQLLMQALYSIKDPSLPNDCWSAFKCITKMPDSIDPICYDLCKTAACIIDIIEKTCPDIVLIPIVPVLFNDIYFAHSKNDSDYLTSGAAWFPFTCYNNSNYDKFFINSSTVVINNLTCHRFEQHSWSGSRAAIWEEDYLIPSYKALKKYSLGSNYPPTICNRSNIYQCIGASKCISIYRLMDGIDDCPNHDDENFIEMKNTDVIERIKQSHFKCQASNTYIPQSSVANGICDCGKIEFSWCEDEDLHINYIKRNISFQTICDGFIELLPILVDGKNHTDETECEHWLCNNIYTRCDGIWNCPNGEDEVGCYSSPLLNCSPNEHLCVSSNASKIICLPINKVNDGNIDCLGAFDEPNLCRRKGSLSIWYDFYCFNDNSKTCIDYFQLCNGEKDCMHGDDEQFCKENQTSYMMGSACSFFHLSNHSDVEHFVCESMQYREKKRIIYFSLGQIENSVDERTNNRKFPPLLSTENSQQQSFRCHRGFDLRLWLDNKSNITSVCVCPPSFYGDRCQYQNERVSLSIQFRASSNSWQIPFAIIISLIDNHGIIHSYEQFSYLSMRDCQIKFNIYLLYSRKPKDPTKTYSIHIDIYEKVSLGYRGSLLFPINFPFLPVHRLAFIVDIPRDNDSIEDCPDDQCNDHGKCIRYSNNPQNLTFCQCHQGWSGKFCSIQHNCMCSLDSLCIGVANNNRSICICPLHRFGPRCLLLDTVCSIYGNSTCENDGQCIPNDKYIESNQKFTCICPKGFIGKRCEIIENKIIVSFDKNIILPQSLFIHFIQVMNNHPPRRATTFRTIPFKQDVILLYWSQPFHLVFIELPEKNYYLTVVQKDYNQSKNIIKSIKPSDRCLDISEIFNESIVKLHLVRRIKYYQLPCQRHLSNLSCFYDDIHLCYCQQHGQQRVTNCFEFDHNQTFDCLGQSVCENNARCFQDASNCPQRSMCICSSCYYGSRCQFSTSGFSLSLDAILGYHIQPRITFTQQPTIIQTSAALVIIFIIIGLINTIVVMMTFKNRSVLDVGCGYYLLCTSFATLLTTTMFGFKFLILLLAQMEIITNRSFLSFQCHSIDFLLRIGLNMDQWLNACVTVERAATVIKAATFDKKKSRQAAKKVVIILLIFIIVTNIHDPIYRRLIDEETEDENRIWCIVSYSSSLQTYNWIINLFHFFTPFTFNLMSAIILITKKTHQRFQIQTHRNFQEVFIEQCRQHRHLFISPVVLVILALPRLIILFISKCMKSANDAWLFVIGYFISFIPPVLTFFVFILPSKFYMKELHTAISQYMTHTQRNFHAISEILAFRPTNAIHFQ